MSSQGVPLTLFVLSIFCSSLSFKFSSNGEQVVVTVSEPKLSHDINSHHSTEWIKGPDEFLYQFHRGEQSWIAAREYCLAQNSDLVVLRNAAQLDWLLSHYAPTYSRFAERFLQVGLMLPEGQSREWVWLDGRKDEQKIIGWTSGEPFDHSADGRERCALLRIHERKLDDIDCDENADTHHMLRFICERSHSGHSEQQKSENFIWTKIEQLLEYFGIGKITSKPANMNDEDNYWDENQTISSSERSELAKIYLNESKHSEEEQEEVNSILHTLSQVPSILKEKSSYSLESLRSGQDSQQNYTSLMRSTTITNEHLEKDTSVSQIVESSGEEFRLSRKLGRSQVLSLIELENKGEGSGVDVDKKNIEQDTRGLVEIDTPEKLEKVINSMERMIASLENITAKSTEAVDEKERTKERNIRNMNKEINNEDRKRSDDGLESHRINKTSQSDGTEKLEKAIYQMDSEVTSNTVSDNLEKDFDEEHNKGMPVSDVTPSPEEECDEEDGSGDKERSEMEELSQKPKIPAEREGHVREFLTTLRLFLERAEHNDLRKLLDDDSGKTLLDKMKDAIIAANQREFRRMELLQHMKIKGEDISKVEEPHFMGLKEREDLYKKISGVVIAEAEKDGLEAEIKPSVRTTTEEGEKNPYRSRILAIGQEMIRRDENRVMVAAIESNKVDEEKMKMEKLEQNEAGFVEKKNARAKNITLEITDGRAEKNNELTENSEEILEFNRRNIKEKNTTNTRDKINTTKAFVSTLEIRNNIQLPLSKIIPDKQEKMESIGVDINKISQQPRFKEIEGLALYNTTSSVKLGQVTEEMEVKTERTTNNFIQHIDSSQIPSMMRHKKEEGSRMNLTNPVKNSVNTFNSLPTLEKVLENLGQQFKKLLFSPTKTEFVH